MIPALAIVAAVWTVLACLGASLPGCAYALGRFRARRRDFTVLVLSQPPVPDSDRDWLSVWPTDFTLEDIEQESYDRDFFAIPEVAADMRNAW